MNTGQCGAMVLCGGATAVAAGQIIEGGLAILISVAAAIIWGSL